MFDPLTPADLCRTLADLLRKSASRGRTDDFLEAQLLAASSIARLTAIELEYAPENRRWWIARLVALSAGSEELGKESQAARDRLEEALAVGDHADVQRAAGGLMRSLSASTLSAERALLDGLRALMREALGREVAAFSGARDGPASDADGDSFGD